MFSLAHRIAVLYLSVKQFCWEVPRSSNAIYLFKDPSTSFVVVDTTTPKAKDAYIDIPEDHLARNIWYPIAHKIYSLIDK